MDVTQTNPSKDGGSSKQKKKNKLDKNPDTSQIKLLVNPPSKSPNSGSAANVKTSVKNVAIGPTNPTSQDSIKSLIKEPVQDQITNSQKKRQRHNKKKGTDQEDLSQGGERIIESISKVSNNPLTRENRTLITPIDGELLIKGTMSSEKVSPSLTKLKFPDGSLLADNKMNKDFNEKCQISENGPLIVSEEVTKKTNLKLENALVVGEEAGAQKSKADMRRERRILQEAQRAAKAAGKPTAGVPVKKITALPSTAQPIPRRVSDSLKLDDEKVQKKIAKKLEKQQIPQRTTVQKKVGLFSHLYQYEREVSLTQGMMFSSTGIHPAIITLGLQYAEGVICGSNARCIALLSTFKRVIADYVTPPQKDLSRDLEAKIKPYINFLTQCRPLSVSMSNAIKYIKWHINHIPREMSDAEAKIRLFENIDNFYKEKIDLADKAISKNFAFVKINDGDVILTYAFSSLVCKVLCEAYDSGKKFQVIVADSRPKMEGQEMLRRLVRHGIQCSYILISAVSYIMREVSKVFLGAHALQANGYVMSRVGSSQIALVAKAYNVPVLVCCETYKFCERVQTDAFVCNELGDPDDLVATNTKAAYLSDWRDIQQLNLLNLVYDVTPPDFVAMVITELGMLPCTSVPVVLRVKHAETSDI